MGGAAFEHEKEEKGYWEEPGRWPSSWRRGDPCSTFLRGQGKQQLLRGWLPLDTGLCGGKVPGAPGGTELQSQTPKDPAVNVRNVTDPGSPPVFWLRKRSCRVQEEA